MGNVRIVGNRAGIRALLKDDGVLADLRRRAERVAAAAGSGHGVRAEIGRNRARAAVVTETTHAAHEEATERNLTRALDAAR